MIHFSSFKYMVWSLINTSFYLFFINFSKIVFAFLNMVFIKSTTLNLFDFLKIKIFQLLLLGFTFKTLNLS